MNYKVEIFKTNITDQQVALAVVELLNASFPTCKINFDLNDCDHILRIEGENFDTLRIQERLEASGFYCELL